MLVKRDQKSKTCVHHTYVRDKDANFMSYLRMKILLTFQNIKSILTYVTTATRPDLSSAVNVLSKFMSRHGKEHWQSVKRVLNSRNEF